MQWRGDLGL